MKTDENALKWLNGNELSYKIWNNKYRYNNESFTDWLDRISDGNDSIKELIIQKKFLFGGRICANRCVSDRKLTYSNCYVITPPEDNIESIFDCAKRLARTFSYGGGCGIDLSKLRPNGASTSNAAKESSGPVSFMDIFSQTTQTISQNGRRGALMISMDVRHPDIEEFIDIKTDLNKVTFANISVRMSDDFMEAVDKDQDYILHWPCNEGGLFNYEIDSPYGELRSTTSIQGNQVYYKRVKAREIFAKLVKNNWNYAEPGILYWDRITNYNLLDHDLEFEYAGTNPCAEEPLPAGGSCLLGSINLSQYVNALGHFDFDSLERDTIIAVNALNEVLIDGMDLHPLDEQRQSVHDWRQIGLGTMGLADALIKMKVVYGSNDSLRIIDEIYETMAEAAVVASLQLAKIQGCYPKCNKDLLVESNFIKNLRLPTIVIDDIRKYGLFNSQLLTCAPTGSIGTMLQTSTGVEPIFAMKYTRKTVSLEGKDSYFDVYTKIAEDWLKEHPGKELPNYFIESKDISPLSRVAVQAQLQKWIDASISSTTNLPHEATIENVYDIYMSAWKQGLKGITIYRAGCAREGILTTESKVDETSSESSLEFDSISPVTRDDLGDVLVGETYKHKTACGTLYITINKNEEGNIVEIFTNSSKNGTCKANLNGQTRMASLALRAGVKVEEVIDQLKGIHCQSCAFARAKGNQIDGTSCPDIISKCLKKSYSKVTNVSTEKPKIDNKSVHPVSTQHGEACPECGHSLDHTGGCKTCPECGWSKCN